MPYLHENKQEFIQAVQSTAKAFQLPPSYIEKDYYLTEALKLLVSQFPELVFRGDTALSKVFGVIHRFTEGIELSFCTKVAQTKFKQGVVSIGEQLGIGTHPVQLMSKPNQHHCRLQYASALSNITDTIDMEVSFMPTVAEAHKQWVNSYVGIYLANTSPYKMIMYQLEPVSMLVQDVERIFADKVFTVCARFLVGKAECEARHIYDLHMMWVHIQYHGLLPIAQDILHKTESGYKGLIPSVKGHISIPTVLRQIVKSGFFEQDYQSSIKLFSRSSPVPYATAVNSLKKIADSNIWD